MKSARSLTKGVKAVTGPWSPNAQQLTEAEVLALHLVVHSGGSACITSPLLARTLRDLNTRRPDLMTLTNVPVGKAGRKAHFGVMITAAGRAALRKGEAQS